MSDQKQCPSACEGTPENAASLFLQAQDKISEGIDFSRLVFNAIEGMELDADLKSLSAGVYAIERLLSNAQTLLDQSKGWPIRR